MCLFYLWKKAFVSLNIFLSGKCNACPCEWLRCPSIDGLNSFLYFGPYEHCYNKYMNVSIYFWNYLKKTVCSRMDGLHGSCIFSFLRNLHDNLLVVTFNLHNSLCIEPSSEPSWVVFTFCASLIIILTMVRWYVTMLLSCNSVLIGNSEYFCL